MATIKEIRIDSGETKLAVQDYGGHGDVLLLLHGAGRTAADWMPMAPALAQHRRVLALDLRGHGYSASGEWNLDTVLGDIDAVLDAHSAASAAIAGHSLGGVLAHLYAVRRRREVQVINLDGFALHASEYVGILAETAIVYQDRAWSEWDWTPPVFTDQVIADQKAEMVKAYGLSESASSQVVERMLTPTGGGSLSPRCDGSVLSGIQKLYREILVSRSFFRLVQAHDVRCLIFRSKIFPPPSTLPLWQRHLGDAYGRGIAHQTQALKATRHCRLSERSSNHMMMFEEPMALSTEILEFLNVA